MAKTNKKHFSEDISRAQNLSSQNSEQAKCLGYNSKQTGTYKEAGIGDKLK